MDATSVITEVGLRSVDGDPAKPAEDGSWRDSKALLHKLGVTQQLQLDIVYDKQKPESTVVGYIDRRGPCDVWGNDVFTVKLGEAYLHHQFNGQDAADARRLAERLHSNVPKA